MILQQVQSQSRAQHVKEKFLLLATLLQIWTDSGPINYQWKRDGVVVDGATDLTHVLEQADVGAVITVVANYFDGQGAAESVTSAGTLVVINVNDTPVLDSSSSPELNSVLEDADTPVGQVGTRVSALIDAGGPMSNFSDADGDLPGIAITETNLQGGKLWYSLDTGETWLKVPDLVSADTFFMHATDQSLLYFQPPNDFSGEIADVLTYRAWDRNETFNGAMRPTMVAAAPAISLRSKLRLDTSYGNARAIAITSDERTAFVANGERFLDVIDIENPSAPIRLKRYDPYPGTDYGDQSTGWQVQLLPDENYLYLSDHGFNRTEIIDVSDRANPTVVGQIAGSAGSYSVSPAGDVLYITKGGGGIQALDISTPTNPSLLSQIDGHCYMAALSVDGQFLYASMQSRLYVFDVSEPASPQYLARIDTGGGGPHSIRATENGTNLVVTTSSGLVVFDLSDPASPMPLNNVYENPNGGTSSFDDNLAISRDGQYAFVGSGGGYGGVDVYDISTPLSITKVCSYESGEYGLECRAFF